MLQTSRLETIHNHPEILSRERTVYLGKLAIKSEFLGINDPLTHLHQYIERGDSALLGIKMDIETDIAERLPRTPFVNYVGFNYDGNDFLSERDKVSMAKMTSTNLKIFKEEKDKNPILMDEYKRAKLESLEVHKLTSWFPNAPIGSCMIFESLPIGDQKFAISRIYRKSGNNKIEGCFVSLYGSNVERFNEFRKALRVEVPICQNEYDILSNHYEFYAPEIKSKEDFVNFYVGLYDHLINESDGRDYCFGIETNKYQQKRNGLEKARKQPKLSAIYLDTVRALAESNGIITPKLIEINNKLKLCYQISEKSEFDKDFAKNILSDVIAGITSVIDRANSDLLDGLESYDTTQDASYEAVSFYNGQARATGERYESNGCPEYDRQSQTVSIDDSTNEESIIKKAFDINGNELKNFGKPKIGLCRIMNCPSRGEINWLPQKTLVGGCDICVRCHRLFEQGRSPKSVYSKAKSPKPRKAA